MLNPKACAHLENVKVPELPDNLVCEECIKTGDSWVHLRVCLTCGKIHCCDSSPNKHATKHHHETEHPTIASAEPGERWMWCYVDEKIMKY